MACESENHSKFFPRPLQGRNEVIKLNFLHFAVDLLKQFLKSYGTLPNYSSGLFKPRDVEFCSFLSFKVNL